MPKRDIIINILIIFVSGVLFIPFLGDVHLFDWDEINFAEASREMIMTKDFQPGWYKIFLKRTI